ncbi:hypothetical protein C8J56DRAFT_939402 [Mycena floridula]|nr:hypothetical protein C8J56DRAFT_995795 [Mycena floridula]KAJ7589728.1 hypothetical protein C8J56DRAFT_939402 [Mycena floridula]
MAPTADLPPDIAALLSRTMDTSRIKNPADMAADLFEPFMLPGLFLIHTADTESAEMQRGIDQDHVNKLAGFMAQYGNQTQAHPIYAIIKDHSLFKLKLDSAGNRVVTCGGTPNLSVVRGQHRIKAVDKLARDQGTNASGPADPLKSRVFAKLMVESAAQAHMVNLQHFITSDNSLDHSQLLEPITRKLVNDMVWANVVNDMQDKKEICSIMRRFLLSVDAADVEARYPALFRLLKHPRLLPVLIKLFAGENWWPLFPADVKSRGKFWLMLADMRNIEITLVILQDCVTQAELLEGLIGRSVLADGALWANTGIVPAKPKSKNRAGGGITDELRELAAKKIVGDGGKFVLGGVVLNPFMRKSTVVDELDIVCSFMFLMCAGVSAYKDRYYPVSWKRIKDKAFPPPDSEDWSQVIEMLIGGQNTTQSKQARIDYILENREVLVKDFRALITHKCPPPHQLFVADPPNKIRSPGHSDPEIAQSEQIRSEDYVLFPVASEVLSDAIATRTQKFLDKVAINPAVAAGLTGDTNMRLIFNAVWNVLAQSPSWMTLVTEHLNFNPGAAFPPFRGVPGLKDMLVVPKEPRWVLAEHIAAFEYQMKVDLVKKQQEAGKADLEKKKKDLEEQFLEEGAQQAEERAKALVEAEEAAKELEEIRAKVAQTKHEVHTKLVADIEGQIEKHQEVLEKLPQTSHKELHALVGEIAAAKEPHERATADEMFEGEDDVEEMAGPAVPAHLAAADYHLISPGGVECMLELGRSTGLGDVLASLKQFPDKYHEITDMLMEVAEKAHDALETLKKSDPVLDDVLGDEMEEYHQELRGALNKASGHRETRSNKRIGGQKRKGGPQDETEAGPLKKVHGDAEGDEDDDDSQSDMDYSPVA